RELLESWGGESRTEDLPSRARLSVSRTSTGVAIVGVHNEAVHIPWAIRRLVAEGLDVVILDDGSTDGSLQLARQWLARGVVRVETRQHPGVFDLYSLLSWKREIAKSLDYDWIVHCDADEWLHTPHPGRRLVDVFAEAEACGNNVVNFDEFVFVPDEE